MRSIETEGAAQGRLRPHRRRPSVCLRPIAPPAGEHLIRAEIRNRP